MATATSKEGVGGHGAQTQEKSPLQAAIDVTQDRRQPIDKRLNNLRWVMEQNKERIARGSTLSADRIVAVAYSQIRGNPDLLDCTPKSLFDAINQAGLYGWVVDGVLGHASIVPFKNRQAGTTEAVLVPGYKGLRDLVHRAGECQTVMESVHQGDAYEFRGPFDPPQHIRSKDPRRKFKPVAAAYVLAKFRDGSVKCFSWTVEECLAHRDEFSQGWRGASKGGKDSARAKDSPWHPENSSFRVMCMKTVLLDAIHRGEFPISVEAKDLAMREREIETGVSLEDAGLSLPGSAGEMPPESEEPPLLDRLAVELEACEQVGQCDEVGKVYLMKATQEERAAVTKAVGDRQDAIRGQRGERGNKKQ